MLGFLLFSLIPLAFSQEHISRDIYGATGSARMTWYSSYPPCCCGQNGTPKSPTCDPKAPTEECDDYSGCEYIGDFAALGHKSLDYVKTHNLIAFFDASDPNGKNFDKKWASKKIEITKSYKSKTYIFNATIADTCADSDCNGCCTRNSGSTGYLIDVEYYTAMNNFGTTDAASGTTSWRIL